IIDGIVTRNLLKKTLSGLVKFHERKNGYYQFTRITLPEMAEEGEKKHRRRNRDKNMTAWERVGTARDSKRPTSLDYIETVFEEFMELHGDRAFRD
ncbi:acetyl-CoA carboxylase carboxyl transferase subunit beta, partial [Blautia hominis]|nr:acetyl-CoA carboxylase carboxyl transferase subunit beta [Blautia hominis]